MPARALSAMQVSSLPWWCRHESANHHQASGVDKAASYTFPFQNSKVRMFPIHSKYREIEAPKETLSIEP
jgi:hypothetical protein